MMTIQENLVIFALSLKSLSGNTCRHGDRNTGQVGSLLPGNEVPEVQDWLLRSKGAERTRREGGKKEKRPGGHKGTGEGRSRGQVKTENQTRRREQEPAGRGARCALGKPTKQSAHPRCVSAACLRGGRLEGDQGGVSPCRPRPARAGLVTALSCGHLVRSMGAAPRTHTATWRAQRPVGLGRQPCCWPM